MNDLIWEDKHIDRGMTPFEIRILMAFIRTWKPKRILEIGTHKGRTILNIQQAAPSAEIISVDIVDAKPIDIGYPDNVRFIIEDSRTLDFSSLGGLFDFIFIDGDHTYEGVCNDLEKSLRILNNGGVIFLHDYDKVGPFIKSFNLDEVILDIPGINLAYYERNK